MHLYLGLPGLSRDDKSMMRPSSNLALHEDNFVGLPTKLGKVRLFAFKFAEFIEWHKMITRITELEINFSKIIFLVDFLWRKKGNENFGYFKLIYRNKNWTFADWKITKMIAQLCFTFWIFTFSIFRVNNVTSYQSKWKKYKHWHHMIIAWHWALVLFIPIVFKLFDN